MLLVLPMVATSCYSPEERLAVNYLKSHTKCPSTFKVLEINSKDYSTQSASESFDTVFFLNGDEIYSFQKEKGMLYDSIIVNKSWYEVSPAKMVSITYQSNNLMNAPVKGHETIIVRNGKARWLMDDITFQRRKEVVEEKKFQEVQVY